MDVGSLVTRLLMDANQFDSTINKSQKEIAAFKSKAESVGNGVNKVFSGVAGTALKLVPAIAAGTTALGAFNKVLKSSGSLADSFDKISLQIGSSIDYLASRASELNFENAIDGLKESIRLAGQLAETLDGIGTHNNYSAWGEAKLRKFKAIEDRERANYELNRTPENKARLDAAIRARNEQQVIVNKNFDQAIRLQDEKIENYKKTITNNAGFKDDPKANRIAENLARNEKNLAMSQERYKKFGDKTFKATTSTSSPTNLSYGGGTGFIKLTGLEILKKYDWDRLMKSAVLKAFKPFYETTTGQKLTKQGYEEQRRFILISNKEGLEEGSVDISALTKEYIAKEELEAAKYESQAQTLRDEKRARDKMGNGITKGNTKLTNTNESLEEINKKFEDAKNILLMQKNEGYLDTEGYLKGLLNVTNNYLSKLYDPLYANTEGIKDLRIATISSIKDIENQLKDLNKPREGFRFNFGNSNFNLINSNLYRQLEKLITLQLGSDGTKYAADRSAKTRAISIGKDNFKPAIKDNSLLGFFNKALLLDYKKVLSTIKDNDEKTFLGEEIENASSIFERAFGSGTEINTKITSDLVYEFLEAMRIVSALPSDMAKTFIEEWIKLNNSNPKEFYNKGYSSALPLALKSVPNASDYVNLELSPISEVQGIREKAREELNVSKKDLNDYYRQGAPVLDTKDLIEKINAFKDFNNLSNLDFFNNSNLESIDKELQTKLSAFKILMKNISDERKKLENELSTGKEEILDENGKKIGERDLTEDEKNKKREDLKSIEASSKAYKSYLDQIEQAQISTQKLIQISQVFNIKQKEIKEGFDNFRSISSSIGEITNAFSDLDGKVGEFAKTLGALNNFANIVANLVEKLKLLSEAEKAAKIASEATGVAINGETAATNTNTAAKATNNSVTGASAVSTSNSTDKKIVNTAATNANTAATITNAAASGTKIATDVGETASEGTKQASKLPFPANIAAIAAVLAAVGGAAATISSLSRKKYATGGIVTGPGSSFSDSIPISVSNGEMILNKSQQKNLFDLLNYGGGSSRGGGSSEVNFKILGENLVGSINNRNKGRNKIL